MSNIRPDEAFAQNQFDEYLRTTLRLQDIRWSLPQQDPPDRWLELGNERFAVEITRLMDKYDTAKGNIPSEGIDAALNKFVAEVEQETKANGLLIGTYRLRVANAAFFDFPDQTKAKVLALMRQNQSIPTWRTRVIFKQKLCATIEKLSSDGQELRFTKIGTAWEADKQAEACRSLNEAVTTKAGKMHLITEPKILLLISESPYITLADYISCVTRMGTISDFHSIFVTFRWRDEDIVDRIIYSENQAWR